MINVGDLLPWQFFLIKDNCLQFIIVSSVSLKCVYVKKDLFSFKNKRVELLHDVDRQHNIERYVLYSDVTKLIMHFTL